MVRFYAVRALGEISPSDPQITAALNKASTDKSWHVRDMATKVLNKPAQDKKISKDRPSAARNMKTSPVPIEETIRLLECGDFETRYETACRIAFGRVPSDKAAVPALIRLLKSQPDGARHFVAGALWRIGPDAKEAVPALIEAYAKSFEDGPKKDNVREGTSGALVAIGIEAIPFLLKEKDPRVRSIAKHILTWSKSASVESTPCLIELLDNKDPEIRVYAVRFLGLIGPEAKAASPRLKKALQDEVLAVMRFHVTVALLRIETPKKDMVPFLIESLKNKDVAVRFNAAYELYRMGSRAKQAIPALIELKKDENKDVRETAVSALKQIQKD